MAKYIHNKTASTKTYEGVDCAADAFLMIPESKLAQYANSDFLIQELAAGNAKMSEDGETDISGSVADQINFLKDFKPVDSTGRPIVRSAVTQEGWSAQFHSLGFTTSKLNAIQNKDALTNSDLGFVTAKFYDADNNELTTQESIDSSCVKSVIDWQPNHDYEIVGGQLMQGSVPATDIYLWVVGLPGILNVKFAQGGVNLKLAGTNGKVNFDGRASKFLPYSGGAGTNKFQLILRHNAGIQHQLQLVLEIFKA